MVCPSAPRVLRVTGVALLIVACVGQACESAPREDCAVSSLTALLSIIQGVVGPPRMAAELGFSDQPPYSLLDIKQAAAGQGLELEGRVCTWEEATTWPMPVVLALKDPDHFLVLLNQDGQSLQVADSGALAVAQAESLRTRFQGTALFPVLPETGGPRVVVEHAHYDGGTVGVGERIVHSFSVRNAGDGPLTLALPSSTCCGLTAALEREEVAPGETTAVVVGVQVTSFGPVLRAVRIGTSDSRRRCVYLTVGARTPAGVRVSPERVTLICDNFPDGRDRRALVTVTGTTEVEVLGVKFNDVPALAILGATREIEGIRRWEIAVTPMPHAPPGEYHGAAVIEAVVAAQTTPMTIPVALYVRPDIVVQPAVLVFPLVDQGAKVPMKRIRAFTRSGVAFRVLVASSSDGRIKVYQGNAPNRYHVTVSTETPGVFEGEVLLTTDLPLEGTVRLPVYAHIVAR